MKLTGHLKDQVEKTTSREEAKTIIEKASMLLADDELNMVSGGSKYTAPTTPEETTETIFETDVPL